MISPELFKLRPLADYQVSRCHVFPSSGSMEWFVHRNRARLVKAGALVKLTGRSLVHEEKFDAEVLAIGQEAMTAEAA